MIKIVLCLAVAVLLTAPVFTRRAGAAIDTAQDFNVEFTNCVESIGVGLVPTASVQPLLPSGFHVVGEGQPVTPIVVRTSDCGGIAVDGKRARAGSVVQIGAVIVPPDFTGDINNYTLWYYTSDTRLGKYLEKLGIDAQRVPTIDYAYESGVLHVNVDQLGSPRLRLDGNVVESSTPAGSFNANWWVKIGERTVKMDTLVPEIFIGSASLMLTTDANSMLGPTLSFPVLEQFNTFPAARMKVTVP